MFSGQIVVLSKDLSKYKEWVKLQGAEVKIRLSKNTDYFILTVKAAEGLISRIETAKKNKTKVVVDDFIKECKDTNSLADYRDFEIEIEEVEESETESDQETTERGRTNTTETEKNRKQAKNN
ncbi:hypothetical protein M0813_03812 [Anaeramoeba flamelloides]|uniref:BRCT domain-containing protein n=1 Tax=Anaeramoeba flamelloides TaxID=1746091 RepID=A0ABQ8XSQ6_9EUKA|nr:hypothetical protein M0813_03812 [Anaeramoeba flamelloides]